MYQLSFFSLDLNSNSYQMLAVPGKPCPKHESIIRTGPSLDDPEFKKIIDFESPEGKELLAYLEKNTGMVRTKV